MKIPAKNIDGFVKKPPAETLALLVYGPDEGLMRERMDILTRSVVADIRDPFNVAEFSAAALAENPSRLLDEALALSMLGGRRVVRVHDAGDSITGLVKDALSALKPGDNLIVIGAGDLGPRSSLRDLFEKAPSAAAIPCYVEDARDIGRVIGESLRAAGYNPSPDALAYLAQNVTGDRAVARSEVEKLITYMGAEKKISFEDAAACVGDSADLPLDDLAKNAASGNFAEADRVLNYLLSEGMPPVTILRSLQGYFMRLHVTKARVQKGEGLEDAGKKLRPPLFWKAKASFEAQVTGWSAAQMERAISVLAAAEAQCKQTGSEPAVLCGRAVLALSQVGAKALNRRRA